MSVRTLAAIGIAGPIVFAAAVLIQDLLQYDYLVANGDDPWRTSPISVNALGPIGWIQILAFATMGVSVLALAVAALRGLPGRSIAGPAFMGLWGLAWLLAVFPIERQPHSFSGYMHGVAFVLLSLVAVPMLLFMWRRLRRAPGWESLARYSLILGVLWFPLEFTSIPLQTIVPFPWLYVSLALLLIWCVLLGLRLWRLEARAPNRLAGAEIP